MTSMIQPRPPPSSKVIRRRRFLVASLLAIGLIGVGTAVLVTRHDSGVRPTSSRLAASAPLGQVATTNLSPTTTPSRVPPSSGSPSTGSPSTGSPSTGSPGPSSGTMSSTTAVPSTRTLSTGGPVITAGHPLSGKVIAIDPGHNGDNFAHQAEINQPVPAGGFAKACDTTGTATDGGYTEAQFNFNVATDLAVDLRALGATVVLTRTTNTGWGPCIDQRAAIGNAAHASAAVSIHADGGPAGGRGFDVIQPGLVPGYNAGIIGPSHALGVDIRNAYITGTGVPYANYVGSQALDTRTDLGGLNLSAVPKVLIECGNMRNAVDASLLVTSTFQQGAAKALAAGLLAYLTGF